MYTESLEDEGLEYLGKVMEVEIIYEPKGPKMESELFKLLGLQTSKYKSIPGCKKLQTKGFSEVTNYVQKYNKLHYNH